MLCRVLCVTSSRYIVMSPFFVAAAMICASPFENAVASMAPFPFEARSVGYSKKTRLISDQQTREGGQNNRKREDEQLEKGKEMEGVVVRYDQDSSLQCSHVGRQDSDGSNGSDPTPMHTPTADGRPTPRPATRVSLTSSLSLGSPFLSFVLFVCVVSSRCVFPFFLSLFSLFVGTVDLSFEVHPTRMTHRETHAAGHSGTQQHTKTHDKKEIGRKEGEMAINVREETMHATRMRMVHVLHC